MNHVLVSYILGRIAHFADVNPANVQTSLLNGTIAIDHLSIRSEMLEKVPFKVQQASIGHVYLKIPNPASSAPIIANVKGALIRIPLHAFAQNPSEPPPLDELSGDCTFDELFAGESSSQNDAESLRSSVASAMGEAEGTSADSLSSIPDSCIDEADLLSCLSDEEDEGLLSRENRDDDHRNRGVLGFFKAKVKNSVLWVMDRAVEVEISDVKIEVIIDERQGGVAATASLSLVTAVLQRPTEPMNGEYTRHISLQIRDIVFAALFGSQKASLVRFPLLESNVSLLYRKKTETLLRCSATIAADDIQIALHEFNAGIVMKCVEAGAHTMEIPVFCRPYLHYRSQGSWWRYALHCVAAMNQDHRCRYNFNMSHIQFYCNVRRRYMRLLDKCCSDRLIGSRCATLAELEADLRYSDVISFLRNLVLEKHGISISKPAVVSCPAEGNAVSVSSEPLPFAVHVDIKVIRFHLPLESTLSIIDVRVEQHLHELRVSTMDISFEKGVGGVRHSSRASEEVLLPLLCVKVISGESFTETKLTLQPMRVDLSVGPILNLLRPIRDLVGQPRYIKVIQQLRATTKNSPAPPKPVVEPMSPKARTNEQLLPTPNTSTLQLQVEFLRIEFNHFALQAQKGAVTIQHCTAMRYPQFGGSLKELSVCWGDTYLIKPLHVFMRHDDVVCCSIISIGITRDIWYGLQSMIEEAQSFISNDIKQLWYEHRKVSSQPKVTDPGLSGDVSMSELLQVNGNSWKKPERAQMLWVEKICVYFELLEMEAEVENLYLTPVSRVRTSTQLPSLRNSFSSVATSNKSFSVGKSGKMDHGWRIAVQSIRVCIGKKEHFTVIITGGKTPRDGGERFCAEVYVLPSGHTAIQVADIAAVQFSPSFLRSFQLVSVPEFSMVAYGKAVALRVPSLVALEGMLVEDAYLFMRGEPLAFEDRPYLSSIIHVGASIKEVNLMKVGKFVPFPLIRLGVEIDRAFSKGEIVSQPVYDKFYSGFSHIVISVAAKNCTVVVSDMVSLRLQLRHSLSDTVKKEKKYRGLLRVFGESSRKADDPIILFADTDKLFTQVMVGELEFLVSSPNVASRTGISFLLREVVCQLPMSKLKVWNAKILSKPTPLLQFRISQVSLSTQVACPSSSQTDCLATIIMMQLSDTCVEVKQMAGSQEPVTLSNEGNSLPKLAKHSTGSLDDGGAVGKVAATLQRLSLNLNTAHSLDVYQDFFNFCEPLLTIPRLFDNYLVVSSSITSRDFLMEATGNIFFHQTLDQGKPILVESCKFSCIVGSHSIVICENTSVIFRNCIFEHNGTRNIKTSSSTSFFFCDACSDLVFPLPKVENAGPKEDLKMTLKLEALKAELEFPDRTICRVCREIVQIQGTIKSSLFFFRILLDGEGMRIKHQDMETVICPSLSLESEFSFKPSKHALAATLHVTVGKVSLPLLVHVWERVATLARMSQTLGMVRTYEVSKEAWYAALLPLDEWKLLLSISVIPIELVLPNGCPFAHWNISNAYLYSVMDSLSNSKATLEGHLGISQISLLEFTSCTLRPINNVPLDMNITGKTNDLQSFTVDMRLTMDELAWNTDQLRMLLTLSSRFQSLPKTSIRICNHTGDRLKMQCGDVLIEIDDKEVVLQQPYFAKYMQVVQVGDEVVLEGEKLHSDSAIYGLENALSFAAYSLRTKGTRTLLYVNAVTDEFVQEMHVYSAFLIKNETLFSVSFSVRTEERSWKTFLVVPPNTFSCLPWSMMETRGIAMSLSQSINEESSPLTLWDGEECALDFIDTSALSSAYTSKTLSKAFPFPSRDGLKSRQSISCAYIDISFELSWEWCAFLFITPSQLTLRNESLFPITVDITNSSHELKGYRLLEPGEEAHVYDVDPRLPYECRFRATIGDMLYRSVDQFLLHQKSSSKVMMRSSSHGGSIALSVVLRQARGTRLCGWAITTASLCYIESRWHDNISFVDSDGQRIGTVPSSGIPCELWGNDYRGGYVPIRTPICLKVLDHPPSDPFEIVNNGEGNITTCGLVDCHAVSYVFLLRPVSSKSVFCMEILPPLLVRNKTTFPRMLLKHEIREKGSTRCVFSRILEVFDDSSCTPTPYFMLASSNYTNFFAFSLAGEQFSPYMESDLAPGTSWTGLLECGEFTNSVVVSKESPYDPAVIEVGPPERSAFQFINFSSYAFEKAPPWSIYLCASAQFLDQHDDTQLVESTVAWDRYSIVLKRTSGARYRVPVSKNSALDVESDLVIFTLAKEAVTTVIACDRQLNDGNIYREILENHFDTSISLSTSGISLSLDLPQSAPLRLSIEKSDYWLSISDSVSIQASISGICLRSFRRKVPFYVIEPFEIHGSARDTTASNTAIRATSFHLTVTPLVLVVSDFFLDSVLNLVKECGHRPVVSFSGRLNSKSLIEIASFTQEKSCPKRIYIENAVLSPVSVEVSWERGTDPDGGLQKMLPWWTRMIPSLHHAVLTMPQVELHQISRDSVALLAANIRSLYLKELLKQIPKAFGTVGLFRKDTSILRHIASKIGGLFSSTEDFDHSSGSSTLL